MRKFGPDGGRGVQAQAVDPAFVEPPERALHEEGPDRVAVGAVEVQGRAPRVAVAVAEIGAELAQEAQTPRLVPALTVRSGKGQAAPGECERIVELVGQHEGLA